MSNRVVEGQPLLRWICKRIADNRNCIINISGATGSGKSYSAMWIGQQLHEMQNLPPFTAKNVAFKPTQLMDLVNSNLPKGSTIVLDEAGLVIYNRDWQSPINKLLVYVAQSFRYKNLILIMTLPSLGMLDSHFRALMHLSLETQKIDKAQQRVALKPLIVTQDQGSGKLYKKFLRVEYRHPNVPDFVQWQPLVRQWAYLPNQSIVDEYEQSKREYCDSLSKEIGEEIWKLENKKKKPTFKQQIPNLIKQGLSNKEIAIRLGCSVRTVERSVSCGLS